MASADNAGSQNLGSMTVTSAAGFEQKITDAPASISVITGEELRKKPYATLLDAVRGLEGVDIGETRDKTGQGTISLRGMGSDYTLILVNGKRQSNHGDIYPNSFGGNQFNHIPPLEAIERIEIIRGPASTLYGAEAMGGVINIITKKVGNKWSGSLNLGRTFQSSDDYGDDSTIDFSVQGPLIKDKLGLGLRGSRYERDASSPTYVPTYAPDGSEVDRSLGFGGGGKTVDNENQALGATLSWKPTEKQSVTLDVDTSRQEYNNKPVRDDNGDLIYPVGTVDNISSLWLASGGTSNASADGSTPGDRTRANPRVGYAPTQEFTRDSWALTHEGEWDFGESFVSLAYVETNNNGRTLPFTVAEREKLLEMINATGDYAGMSEADRKELAEETFLPRPKRVMQSNQMTVDAKLDMPIEEMAGDHRLVVGTQITRGELKDGVFGMEKGKPGGTQEHNMVSLFAEDTWTMFEPFSLTLGLRHDDHEAFGSHLSPRVYGVYTLNDQWTFKGGISTGYKAPKTTDLYDGVTGFGGQGTSPMFGNPDLKPEISTSREAAIYWQNSGGSNFNVTLFQNRFEDKITSQPCGSGTDYTCVSTGEYADLNYASSSKKVNIDEVDLNGYEVAGRWQVMNALAVRANYTYTDSEQKSGEDEGLPLGNSAKHMYNAAIEWQPTDRLNFFVLSENHAKRYRGQHVITDESLYYKDYSVLHLGGSYKINDYLTLNARVNNLLDKDFTTYRTEFRDLNSDGDYTDTNVGGSGKNETLHFDDYNNKEACRSFWVSLNARF